MSHIVREVTEVAKGNKIIIYCWRGGKRSGSIAWLLTMAGLDIVKLEGGYKSYRKFIRNQFSARKPNFTILTGSTGSGKTETLRQLQSQGEQVIDLEAIAHHKGSAFGNIGEACQPTTEQFENNLYEVFRKMDFTRNIWLESESRMIGNIALPDTFWEEMKNSKMIHLKISKEIRIQYLVDSYGQFSKKELSDSFKKLKKKLAQNLPLALEALEQEDMKKAARIALDYYDRYYEKHLEINKNRILRTLEFEEMEFSVICDELLQLNLV